MADELFRDYCMIKIDMIEIIERKKKNHKKNPPSTFARVKLQHLAREQIAIKTTHRSICIRDMCSYIENCNNFWVLFSWNQFHEIFVKLISRKKPTDTNFDPLFKKNKKNVYNPIEHIYVLVEHFKNYLSPRVKNNERSKSK